MEKILLTVSVLVSILPFTLSAGQPEFSDSLPTMDELFTNDTLARFEQALDEGETGFNSFFTDDSRAVHLPAINLSDDLIQAAYAIDYVVGVESLYLIPWNDVSRSLTSLPREEFLLEVYNILRSISSLQGIEYYSASRERMRTLFAEAWAINNPDEKKKIADPLVDQIPDQETIYIHQKDLTFGKNISKVDYQSGSNSFRMNIVNLTTMTYMFFPIVGKQNMSMQMLIVPSQQGVVFYGLNTVDVMDLKIFHNKMRNSFTNRMIALYNWFLVQLQT
ncbi:MAG: DUF6675 family protein [Spirochaetota bacterium]